MTATQLRLLRVLALQLVPDAVQQLHIALLRILLQSGDESPRHGARGLSSNLGILRSLGILAARPHDDIGGRGLGLLVPLKCGIASGGFFEQAHGGGSHAAHIPASIC